MRRREKSANETSLSAVRDRRSAVRAKLTLPVLPTDPLVTSQADAVLRIIEGEPSVGKMEKVALHAAEQHRESAEAGKHGCSETACTKRCFYCCHLANIAVAIPEVVAVAEHVKRNATPSELDALRQRIDTHGAETSRLRGQAQEANRYPCPLLVGGCCSVYEVRPLACRGWNSLDVAKCREDFLYPERDVVAPVSWPQVEESWKLRQGMYVGLRRAGLKHECVDFIPALKTALDRPDVVRQWLAGGSYADPDSDAPDVLTR